MSFDWAEYLCLAKHLRYRATQKDGGEADLRSAISRAYYAAFCIAKNHLASEGHDIPKRDTHKYVADQFKWDCERRGIGLELDRLRGYRQKADYDNVFSDAGDKVAFVIEGADEVITEIRRL